MADSNSSPETWPRIRRLLVSTAIAGVGFTLAMWLAGTLPGALVALSTVLIVAERQGVFDVAGSATTTTEDDDVLR